ncbi:MAG TPA: patatin-like protein [Gammaproteobacteria bacterium]|nr:patatin-like protein [Gammaproteobacteria bacterium]
MSQTTAVHVDRTEELRLALVMNGGVSLAVWIGGVSYEINRFVGETHPVYRQLLELTRTHARVDVISGTSAGGINGAALALATVYDKSLYKLRDIWLNRAAFADLLRRPSQANPPSLLAGNEYFLPLLRDAFRQLVRERPRDARQAPMDLSLPATLLRGEPHTRLDDLGELIEDATHRGRFRFWRDQHHDPFVRPAQVVDALAHAARASASFPVAFEPVLAQASEVYVADGQRTARFAHYLIDGGVLDNKPIEGALHAILRMPTHGNVRRVLAYVVPDPSVSAAREDDDKDSHPLLAQVALASLVSIRGAESIADQLAEIERHNEQVRHNRNLPATLATTLSPWDLNQLKLTMFDAYRARRISGVLDYVLDEIEHSVSSDWNADKKSFAFGRRTRTWLKAVWFGMAEAERDEFLRDFIPTAENAWRFDLVAQRDFTWGQYALEFLASVMIDLLRRTQRLQHLSAQEQTVVAPLALQHGEAGPQEWDSYAATDWESLDQTLRDARTNEAGEPADALAPQAEDHMSDLWRRAFAFTEELRNARAGGIQLLRENAKGLLQSLAEAVEREAPLEAQENAAREWLGRQFRGETQMATARGATTRRETLGRHAERAAELAGIVLDLRDVVAPLISPNYDVRSLRPEDQGARQALVRLCTYLYEPDAKATNPDINSVMHRLLAFEVVQYAVSERPRDADTFVELIQISARQASPWGGATTPEEKLAGMQLAHFGAFYRKAWRANDWMIGRLDGIGRIVRIALNPDRLQRLYAGRIVHWNNQSLPAREYVMRMIEELSVRQAQPAHRALLERHWHELQGRVWNELSFLESARTRVPDTLDASCEALTRRLHIEVLCGELPQLAAAVLDDLDVGAASSSHGTRLAAQVAFASGYAQSNLARRAGQALRSMRTLLPRLPTRLAGRPTLAAEEAVRMFDTYRVGTEALADEMGTDLMLRTGAQTLAVAHAAASGKRSGMAPLAPLLNAFRWPVRLFHLLAARLSQDSRASAAITTAILVAGMLLAYVGLAWDKAPPGTGAAGWALLFAWFVTAYLRRPWVSALGAVALAFMLYMAAGPETAIATAVVVVLVILALMAPVWASTTLIALAGAWWLTGKPEWADVASALCAAWHVDSCPVRGDAAAASSFVAALALLALVVAIALLSRLAGQRR